jgi:hypothetical protein
MEEDGITDLASIIESCQPEPVEGNLWLKSRFRQAQPDASFRFFK